MILKTIIRFGLMASILASSFLFANSAHAETMVEQDIEVDTTWSLAGSPYILDRTVIVFENTTLTIEPGVEIKFKPNFFNPKTIYVYGKILAHGTSASPITFTSFSDDTFSNTDDEADCYFLEYDEEGNGIGEEICDYYDWYDPEVGDWNGLYFSGSEDSVFENVNLKYTKRGITLSNSDFILQNSTLTHNTIGITAFNNSTVSINGLTVDDINKDALVLFNDSFANFKNISITNVAKDPITIFNRSVFSGQGLNIEDNYFNFIGSAITLFNSSSFIVKEANFKNCSGYACVTFFDGSDFVDEPSVLDISDSIFESGSGSALLTFANSAIGAKVSNSVFVGFEKYAIESYAPNFTINAEKNFWGDSSGPYEATQNPSGLGEEIYGKADFDPWLKRDPRIKYNTPVIFIPGVMGNDILRPAEGDETEPQKLWLNLGKMLTDINDQFLDALELNENFTPVRDDLILGDVIREPLIGQHFYDKIINELISQGYQEGVDIFTFPYDWRFGISEDNVQKLSEKIAQVLELSGSDAVDIVAHSTGGLLAKKYVMENPDNHHISKAVFVGVPSVGAPQAIKMLLQGASIGIPFLEEDEMKKIARNMPVVYDLSPSKQYFDAKGSYLETRLSRPFKKAISKLLNFDEANDFLLEQNMNSVALSKAHDLHTKDFDEYDMRSLGVDLYNIAGCKAGTVGRVVRQQVKHLIGPDTFEYLEPLRVPGDGTVPLESATYLPVDSTHRFFALNANHSKMPSQDGIRQLIINILAGTALDTDNKITQDISKCKLNGRAIAVYSPIDIEVFDQFGNRVGLAENGLDIETNIPNASFEISDGHKYLYLPTDDGQIYTINIKGTDQGTFTITDTNIDEDTPTRMQVFKDIPVSKLLSGRIVLGENTVLNIDEDGSDDTADQSILPSLVLVGDDVADYDPFLKEAPIEITTTSSGSSGGGGGGGDFPVPVFITNTINTTSIPNISAPLELDPDDLLNTVSSKGQVLGASIEAEKTQTKDVVNKVDEKKFAQSPLDPKKNNNIIIILGGAVILVLLAKRFIKL